MACRVGRLRWAGEHAMDIVVDLYQGPSPRRGRHHCDDVCRWPVPACLGNVQATPTAGMSTVYARCCIASAAVSCSMPGAAMPIWVPAIGWCCHRIPQTRPSSAPKGSVAWMPPAKVSLG